MTHIHYQKSDGILKYGSRIVGEVKGKTFVTDRSSNHFMVKYNGFGLSLDIITFLISLGVEKVLLRYHGKRGMKFFVCSLSSFANSKKKHTFGEDDVQHFLSIKEMDEREVN